jgi:spoIIIJ-associated protein
MLKKEDIEKIKKEVEEFFRKMGIEAEIEILPEKDSTLPINLKTDDFQILIGEEGKTLFEIQHLLKAILKKKIKENFYLDLDVAGYKKKKITYLKELARSVADEVSLTKRERVLEPMPAFERRIIHLELASRPDVTTESIGKEPKRRVVIKPYP